jgi:hypothetical protein
VPITSCKKVYILSKKDLIGRWQEVSPCIHPGQCYTLQFDSNNTVTESSPDSFISNYTLYANNGIELDDSIPYGLGSRGSIELQIKADIERNLNILGFYKTASAGSTVSYDLHLTKVN